MTQGVCFVWFTASAAAFSMSAMAVDLCGMVMAAAMMVYNYVALMNCIESERAVTRRG